MGEGLPDSDITVSMLRDLSLMSRSRSAAYWVCKSHT